jgi:glycosyltransferase involved in cell wall biosynthesis
MKITHITPGLLPIPPNGWGAVEKIIWAYHTQLLKLGHDSQIKYCSDVSKEDKGVIHVHVANLALELRDKNIPYFFTMHDHHAFLYGKNSPAFKQNKEAIEGSILSFAPANYLIEYFGGHKLEYLSHGVDTHFFSPERYVPRPIKLLCVANNGFIHNNSEDRKGFGFAISAAQKLGLPITVAGPSNNKHFFTTCRKMN